MVGYEPDDEKIRSMADEGIDLGLEVEELATSRKPTPEELRDGLFEEADNREQDCYKRNESVELVDLEEVRR